MQKHIGVAIVAAVIGLLALCGSSIYTADSGKPDTPVAIEKTRDIKAVYQIKTDDWKKGVGSGLYYVEKLANAYAGMGLDDEAFQISAVLHGAAGYWLLKDDGYQKETGGKPEDNPNKAIIQRLLDRGISVELCAQTMKSHGWKADDVLPGVTIVIGAYPRIIDLQHQGYAYIRF